MKMKVSPCSKCLYLEYVFSQLALRDTGVQLDRVQYLMPVTRSVFISTYPAGEGLKSPVLPLAGRCTESATLVINVEVWGEFIVAVDKAWESVQNPDPNPAEAKQLLMLRIVNKIRRLT